jgi:hypothetical protein
MPENEETLLFKNEETKSQSFHTAVFTKLTRGEQGN